MMLSLKYCYTIAGIIAIAALVACSAQPAQSSAKTVRFAGTLQLSPADGFVDYLVVDPQKQRMYAGYASENKLVVIDTSTHKVLQAIDNLGSVRSIALVPALQLGFTSNRDEDNIGVIDLTKNRLLQKIPDGRGPDAIIYDEADKLIYIADHEGKAGVLVDPALRKVIARIPLGGLAEYAQADPETGLIYQNLEDTSEVVVVDPKKKAIIARYNISPGDGPTGLALDAIHHRLFSACGNKMLIVMSTDNGKVIATLPIGAGVDFVAYDSQLSRLYTANGASGTMTVIEQKDSNTYQVLENVPTHRGAHALAIDPHTHRIYIVYGGHILIYDNL